MPIDPKSIKWDEPAPAQQIDAKSVQWDDAPAQPKKRTLADVDPMAGVKGRANLLGGLVRGAGSIGSTLLAPVDMIKDAAAGKGLSLESNRARRHAIDMTLSGAGIDTESPQYGIGKLTSEVAGTAGAGPLLAGGAKAVGAGPTIVNALRSAGFTTGRTAPTVGARAVDMATRAGAGGLAGATAAGMIDPEQAGTGAVIGAALPPALGAVGKVAKTIGSTIRGPEVPESVRQGVQAAREAGYVIPPTQSNTTLSNRLIEGFSGKLTTAQNASSRNQAITNGLVTKELGLPADTQLSFEVLDGVRKEAGQAYDNIAKLGKLDVSGTKIPNGVDVKTTVQKTQPTPGLFVTTGEKKVVDAADLVESWKQANHDATAYYRAYGRDANPETLAKAKAATEKAGKIDGFLESTLDKLGKSDLKSKLQKARVLIAKTYSAESAMNPASGNIDARKFAKQLEKGKFLSGGLKKAGEFAGQFPKAAQTVEGMGSLPQTSPLDWGAAGMLSGLQGNPLFMLSALARPAARQAAMSPIIQNRLVSSPPSANRLADLLNGPDAQQLMYRTAPAAITAR